jgi:hypothetical protein
MMINIRKMSDAESDRIFLLTHSVGMTTEQLGEALLRTIAEMSPDEKAHLRNHLNRSVGIEPKSSDGKPS